MDPGISDVVEYFFHSFRTAVWSRVGSRVPKFYDPIPNEFRYEGNLERPCWSWDFKAGDRWILLVLFHGTEVLVSGVAEPYFVKTTVRVP